MGSYYFDSSALVKRYAQEAGSSWVISLTDPGAGNELFTAFVTGAEIVAAIARKARLGSISRQDAMAAIRVFKENFKTQHQVVLLTPAVLEQAMDLAESHELRGYDAVQLGSALVVQAELIANGAGPLVFVSADTGLNQAAQTEGLAVENPNDHA